MLLTINIVVKDDPKGLSDTLNSLKVLPHNVEICIVTPFNSTETFHSAVYFAKSNLRTRVIQDEGIGIYQAMNIAIAENDSSRWIWFLNAGDTLTSIDALENLLDQLINIDPNTMWVYCGYTLCESSGEAIEKRRAPTVFSIKNQLFARDFVSHQALIARLDLLKKIGGFNTEYRIAADWELICKMSVQSCPQSLEIDLVNFKLGGFSSRHRNLGNLELLKIRSEMLPWHIQPNSYLWFLYRLFRNKILQFVEVRLPDIPRRVRRSRAAIRTFLENQ